MMPSLISALHHTHTHTNTTSFLITHLDISVGRVPRFIKTGFLIHTHTCIVDTHTTHLESVYFRFKDQEMFIWSLKTQSNQTTRNVSAVLYFIGARYIVDFYFHFFSYFIFQPSTLFLSVFFASLASFLFHSLSLSPFCLFQVVVLFGCCIRLARIEHKLYFAYALYSLSIVKII